MLIPRRFQERRPISHGTLVNWIRLTVSISTPLTVRRQRCQSAPETNFLHTCFSISTTCLARSCCNGKTLMVGNIAPTGDRTLLVLALMEPTAVVTWGHCQRPAHGCGSKCQRALWVWKEARSTEWRLLWMRAAQRGTSRAKLRLMQRRHPRLHRVILFGSKTDCLREQFLPGSTIHGTGLWARLIPVKSPISLTVVRNTNHTLLLALKRQ